MRVKAKAVWGLLRQTLNEFNEDKVPRLAAAMAYYTIFSIAPLLIIVIAIAGIVFGQQAAQGQIVGQIRGLVGDQGATMIQSMIDASRKSGGGVVAAVIGAVTLLLGAIGLFGALQDALNTIWEVQPKPGAGIFAMLKSRVLSLTVVLGTGFLLLVSLVVYAAMAGLGFYLQRLFPGAGTVLPIVNEVISFLIITLLFALIFKILPDAVVDWHDVWIGAAMTSVLFMIGHFLIGFYLGRSSYSTTFGAAGSLVVVLVWIYYSALILFLGAEFTQVYANRYGSHVRPAPNAEVVTEQVRAEQGIPHQERMQQHVQQPSEAGTPAPRPLLKPARTAPAVANVPRPVVLKTNVLRQRATAASTKKVPPAEQHTQAANPAEPVSNRMSALATVIGVVVGIVAGLSLSRTAGTHTQQESRKH